MSRSPYSSVPTDENYSDDFMSREVRTHRNLMESQNAGLDVLGEGIGRIGELAFGLNKEIQSQNKLIDELDTDMDSTQNNISLVTEKTKDIIKKSGGMKWFCLIVALVIIFLILFFLVIYT